MVKENNLYAEIRNDSSQDNEESDHDRDETAFMATKVEYVQEEEDEEAMVDLEAKLEATLEEIKELRRTSKN